MPSGLLSLRKAQLRALRSREYDQADAARIRHLEHEVIRLHDRLYHAERYDEQVELVTGAPLENIGDLRASVEDATATLTCARCHNQIRGFRNKYAQAVFYTLGLCQTCQDMKPPRKTH